MLPRCLAELMGTTPVDGFIRTSFGRASYRFAGSTPNLALEDFEQLLWSHESSLPQRLVVFSPQGLVPVPRRPHAKDLFRWAVEQFLCRSSLRLENISEIVPWAATLAADASSRLLSKVDVDLLLIPACPGRATHGLDGEGDLVILQVLGTSRWHVESDGYATLQPGEGFYLPRGSFRASEVLVGPSLCILLRITPLSVSDFVSSIIEVATEHDDRLRSTLRMDGSADYLNAVRRLDDHANNLDLRRLAWERLRLRIADEHRPPPGGHLEGGILASTVGEDTLVRVRAGAAFVLIDTSLGVFLYVPGLAGATERDSQPGGLLFPLAARPLLAAIVAKAEPFTARDLPNTFSAQARIATLRRLVREGALTLPEAVHA